RGEDRRRRRRRRRRTQPPAAPTISRLGARAIPRGETKNRQHKLFDQTLAKMRDTLTGSFNSFAADTQRAYQNLRQETQGEKRFSLALLNELLDIHMEMQHIVAQRPALDDATPMKGWADAVE